jgi:PAS domain S-box-containing protein
MTKRNAQSCLVDQAPIPFVVVDTKGVIALWNVHAEQFLGWQAGDVIGRGIFQLSERRNLGDSCFVGAVESTSAGQPWEGEIDLIRKDRKVISAMIRASPFVSPRGAIVGALLVMLPTADMIRAANTHSGLAVARRIALARRTAGLTQEQLAERIGVTRRSIQNYESGAVVPYNRIAQLAAALGSEPRWLHARNDFEPGDADPLREVVRDELRAALSDVGLNPPAGQHVSDTPRTRAARAGQVTDRQGSMRREPRQRRTPGARD